MTSKVTENEDVIYLDLILKVHHAKHFAYNTFSIFSNTKTVFYLDM